MSEPTTAKPTPKMRPGHFKCFQCRKAFAGRDGQWHTWDNMQVHLCSGCERTTRDVPERKK